MDKTSIYLAFTIWSYPILHKLSHLIFYIHSTDEETEAWRDPTIIKSWSRFQI